MQLDTRAQARRILGLVERTAQIAILKTLLGIAAALTVMYLPEYLGYSYQDAGLSPAGQACLGILVFAAFCWVSEALPAFAVGLCVIGLEIAILGRPGGVFTSEGDTGNWQMFVEPWASPIMWLFLGGFTLAHAAAKVGLDRQMAGFVISRTRGKPQALLAGVMALTFILSMFMSNTATAAMMVALLAPVVAGLPATDRFTKCLYLGVPVAANIGGMGTIIGTPPNAIVIQSLQGDQQLNFLQWMIAAAPPALVICVILYFILLKLYPCSVQRISLPPIDAAEQKPFSLQTLVVIVVFLITVGCWMTSEQHGIPAAVISFIPVMAFAATGVLSSKDVRTLPWDVLLLLAGGLALGVGVKATGLASWLANLLPGGLSMIVLIALCMGLALVLSNLMSNTATASILAPLAGGLIAVGEPSAPLLVLIAIACSGAMCLPISTPPNAVAFASGKIEVKDFLKIGLIGAIIIPIIAAPWIIFIVPRLSS